MKLAFISMLDIAPWGGSEVLWSQAAQLALQRGHQVFTSTYFWEEKPAAITELAHSGAQTFFRKGYNPAIAIRLYNRIRNKIVQETPEIKALKKFEPDRLLISLAGSYDILHNPGLVAYLLKTTKPYFIICHSYEEAMVLSESKRNIMLQLLGKAQTVFMISKIQEAIISKQLVHKLANTRIIANPVILKELTLLPLSDLDNVQLASVASLDVAIKGQDIILEVLSKEKWKQRNWKLNIYGAGPDKDYLEQLIAYFGLEERVVLKGHVHDINMLWRQNHVFLLSSRKESGPMALTEAMLCGRPVVATLVGLVHEMMQDGYNGFVAEAATVNLFDEALERAWQNKEQWPIIGKRAHQTALAAIDIQAPATFLDILINTK